MEDLPTLADLTAWGRDRHSLGPKWKAAGRIPEAFESPIGNMTPASVFVGDHPMPHALVLDAEKSEALYFLTDREGALGWAEALGTEDDLSVSDVYQCWTWQDPSPGAELVAVHEFDNLHEGGADRWCMIQVVAAEEGA